MSANEDPFILESSDTTLRVGFRAWFSWEFTVVRAGALRTARFLCHLPLPMKQITRLLLLPFQAFVWK